MKLFIFLSEKSLHLSPFALVGCHVVLLLYEMDEREEENRDDGNGYQALVSWKSLGTKY